MSPVQFRDDQQARKETNGPRPSPLKINKDSYLIQKSSSSLYSMPSSFNGIASYASTKQQQQQHNQQRHHPVIIYTHSPKIIHTQARDFMALVQKLTGFSRSDDHQVQPQSQQENVQPSSSEGNTRPSADIAVHEENESSSVVTDENYGGGSGGGDIPVSSSSVSPLIFEPSSNPFFSDVPLFTPNSANFFCSPRPYYRYSDSIFTPSNMGSSISPSVLEVMKEFSGY